MKLTPDILYQILRKNFGDLEWWPVDEKYHKKHGSDPRFEVIIGAVLTQNTNWGNVKKALMNLKSHDMIDNTKISETDIKILGILMKPSGFFDQKASRLKNLAQYLQQKYQGNLDKFFHQKISELRRELLSLKGIGPETADSILLYAGGFPVFVVDAYTKRICERLPLYTGLSYDEIQHYFEKELTTKYSYKKITEVYKELHGLIVELAKQYCRKKPRCTNCPLYQYCIFAKQSLQ
jgi:endonuclease-3 related protein